MPYRYRCCTAETKLTSSELLAVRALFNSRCLLKLLAHARIALPGKVAGKYAERGTSIDRALAAMGITPPYEPDFRGTPEVPREVAVKSDKVNALEEMFGDDSRPSGLVGEGDTEILDTRPPPLRR